jgi:hypothetical protein
MKGNNLDEKYLKIYRLKNLMGIDYLCSELPTEIAQYMKIVRALGFEETPDYLKLRKLFVSLFRRNKCEVEFDFDWSKLKIDFKNIRGRNPVYCTSQRARAEMTEELKLSKSKLAIGLKTSSKFNAHCQNEEQNISNINTSCNQLNRMQEETKKKEDDSCDFDPQATQENIVQFGTQYRYYNWIYR